MSTPSSSTTRLGALSALGTSVWLDAIRRSMVESGELERLIGEDSVVGLTSNPSIFQKAMLGSPDYDEALRGLAEREDDAKAIYETLAIEDIQGAAELLHPVYERTERRDGYASFEVAPELALDTEGTLVAARELWGRLERPNVMIKIPGTEEGVPAVRQAIAAGINVNVTLLFAVDAYRAVAEAYLAGLEDRVERGESVEGIASGASIYVSRVDSAVDKRLAKRGREDLAGRAAVANAQVAYAHFEELMASERWKALEEHGAMPQRLLWASTGTKNPAYPDTKYVAELAGPHTVNTMPAATLHAFQEHGEAENGLSGRGEEAAGVLAEIAEAGVDLEEVTAGLLEEGIATFKTAMGELVAGVEQRRNAVVAEVPPTVDAAFSQSHAEAVHERIEWARREQVARRVWGKDYTLWGSEPDEIADRLGWLTIAEQSLEHLTDVEEFVEEVRAEGFTDCALLGMGGSSLASEVMRSSFPDPREGFLALHVLDSTHPDAVAGLAERLPLETTLFVVSSKSGGTLELRSFLAYFLERAGDPTHFVAITDPGTALEREAGEKGFRAVFAGSPEIGGRYSALSAFGILPAALMGIDVRALLERAERAVHATQPSLASEQNAALWLGCTLGELARRGRDKLTWIVDEPLGSFGLWVEQLVAESTGKQGTGIVPVAGEPLGAPEAYGEDRVFVHLRHSDEPDTEAEEKLAALAGAGHPALTVAFADALDLGAQFFLWEFAVAVAGAVLSINAFDQPNVQEAKDLTAQTIEAYVREGSFPDEDDGPPLEELLHDVEPGSYVALMAYLPPSEENDRALERLRVDIRDRHRIATTVGYGPRFLHSTGQLHKGGPASGVFAQIVDPHPREGVEVPGAGYDFAALVHAQALGDGQALRSRGLPFTRTSLDAIGEH